MATFRCTGIPSEWYWTVYMECTIYDGCEPSFRQVTPLIPGGAANSEYNIDLPIPPWYQLSPYRATFIIWDENQNYTGYSSIVEIASLQSTTVVASDFDIALAAFSVVNVPSGYTWFAQMWFDGDMMATPVAGDPYNRLTVGANGAGGSIVPLVYDEVNKRGTLTFFFYPPGSGTFDKSIIFQDVVLRRDGHYNCDYGSGDGGPDNPTDGDGTGATPWYLYAGIAAIAGAIILSQKK